MAQLDGRAGLLAARAGRVVYYCICGDMMWYRFVDTDIEWSRDPYEITFPVIRETAKCVVLNVHGEPRYVLKNARKRFAYPTRELALESYIIRKQRQISWTSAAHDRARDNLEGAEAFKARGMEKEPYYAPPLPFL